MMIFKFDRTMMSRRRMVGGRSRQGLGVAVPLLSLYLMRGRDGGVSRNGRGGGGCLIITILTIILAHSILPVYLHVFTERGRMGVGFIATSNLAVVRFIARVNMRVLFSITRVCKPSITSVELALKRFLT